MAVPVVRGCGTRSAGGIYVEVDLGPDGYPPDWFLFCPPFVPDPEEFSIPAQGVKLFERNGVFHVVDLIGASYYPYVPDFWEEFKRYGLSRKVQPSIPFELITQDSWIFLAHTRAWVDNWSEYVEAHRAGERFECPKGVGAHPPDLLLDASGEHALYPQMCDGVWWHDLDASALTKGSDEDEVGRRFMPALSYSAWQRPADIDPVYRTAIFARLPLSKIVVVRDRDNAHKGALERARRAHLLVEEVDE